MYITADCTENDLLATARMIMTRNGRAVFLRPARPDDAADLVWIQLQVAEEGIAAVDDRSDTLAERREMITGLREGDLYLVAECHRRVVGALVLRRMPAAFLQHHALLGIEMHRDFRGTGLGTALIQHAVEWARENDLEMLRLGVLDSNPRARALYERLGFCETGYIPDFVKRPDGTYVGETQMLLRL
jgi:putative acetyltransferase